ncbi:MAG: 30S ribosome-binding factor RbfA [Nitrospinaceae bacterium]|jgi:ribosome-binding factor A|nr:ribosome-binding factor A [Nitrospinota bacterium]MDP6336135.1 30S ribosome-binding factor RbfA [Nitrospinaceae bacterium]HAX46643.1 30S ribosome-binding factor RbfA [Nitrospina sp.]MBV51702.1 ribosome-binding factor A [Nitrospinota bacterium]MDP7148497.1 30S ribosome-binding factor RbfA [Nitrospinaceae bacterium]|tara:strand:+ start:456 stop:800 length:345 start_codon:yes stop_codon:yes gene_type:complete
MRFKRSERVQELLLEEISALIQRGLKDPRIGFATVTKVNLGDNLKHAKVYISVFGTEQEQKDTIEGLTRASGFIRGALGKKLYLRYIPVLEFILDGTAEHVAKINKIINDFHPE